METLHSDAFSLRDFGRKDIDLFIEQTNTFHLTIKFTAEISEKEITFLDTVVYKGEIFLKEAILDVKTHYKPTETFQYTHIHIHTIPSATHQALREPLLNQCRSKVNISWLGGGGGHASAGGASG